jgi:hypothetical protein
VDDEETGAKRISVTIRWLDRGGKPMKMVYEYMKSDRFS